MYFIKRKLLTIAILLSSFYIMAQKTILINNVQIFNGKDEKTINGNILIVNNLISKISTSPISTDKSGNTTIIDGKGKFLMPGLIDAHTHIMMESMNITELMNSDIEYITANAIKSAEKDLMQGFTTFRDLAGPAGGLQKAIDRGLIIGPRIYPSGAMISQTGGHGDFLLPNAVPKDIAASLDFTERNNFGVIADGPDQVLKRVREQLRLGATQIKLAAGGGVSSTYDPLDVSQFTEAEMKAAVDAAENWGTYVTVHAYTPRAIQTALRAGVLCIDHAQLIDDTTAKMLADKKAWLSLQPFIDEGKSLYADGSPNRIKQQTMMSGTDKAYNFAKKYNIKTAFGTDCLFEPEHSVKRAGDLVKLLRWYKPYEILKMATSTNAELLTMSGPRNPYPNKLGVIEEGAYADIILVDGNPIANLSILEDYDKTLLLIIKDGIIYKNILDK
ncbi:amidohydrolase family protein [Flavobacterium sp. ANB]|uniref:metal-dependent hydrolase family protein n=1 Tax=unclassified Flavobacterium TaxID=196869 RepID=UPI0012B8ABE0|nr:MULTISPECIES: amidohydrolase family protein [unclassified Flavobacterium]MBF4515839.1 amidohydrolase family protein [Flavobacterium sp. ANB]MTD68841.1 amidohydrolase family protein [Flavobacterium sp. LC2016-13]